MSDFVPGQRWVVDAQPELGLGIIVSVEARTIQMVFPQAECERIYTRNNSPLTRVTFDVNDEIHLQDGSTGVVVEVIEQQGVLIYDIGTDQLIPETALSGEIKMNQPLMRLLTGQLDRSKWFAFRRKLDAAMARAWQSHLGGLLGTRASLIPHQLYVAKTACEHEKVRVLLADEVGLGKTIEAGMILSRLLRFERAQRVLIAVPDALQVQWLVELIRRFNLRPELYSPEGHDFEVGQIHLVPHSLMGDTILSEVQDSFDLLIVDEAHHIEPGTDSFSMLQRISETTDHLILLSATPEQLGIESHFARLQLLDPDKFSSFEDFTTQESSYVELNAKLKSFPQSRSSLITEYGLSPELNDQQMLDQLLDCHGVGRVMYRNTRASVKGFPKRVARLHELLSDDWESKYQWLLDFAKLNVNEKILVIFHSVEHVKECESFLWEKQGAVAALFHEGMDLIERDRAAAFFADEEGGSQLLLCSEIGSEGRNFQFSHHLVCMDLPAHPDLLEQRIGRLDRIGQSSDVNIHLTYSANSAEAERLFWYHEVLQCIDRQSPAAGAIHEKYWPSYQQGKYSEDVRQLAISEREALETQITEGRDALLEKNSCRQPAADSLLSLITDFESETPLELIEQASDLLNFHFEEISDQVYSLTPADNMLIQSLPGVPAEGIEVTFERDVANAREDVWLLGWDAPLVVGLWELLHHSDLGSASVALLPSKQLPAGRCLVEACFDLIIQSPQQKSCLPYLPELSVRALVLDVGENDLSEALPEESLENSLQKVDKKLARKIVNTQKEQLSSWYHKAEVFAEQKRDQLIETACDSIKQHFSAEIQRLEVLAKRNPSVSAIDVHNLKKKEHALLDALRNHSLLQLSAIRLIVTTESS